MVLLGSDGFLWSYGWGTDGQLGYPARVCSEPTLVPHVHGVRYLSCGGDSSFCLTHEGMMYAWGNAEYGQLGNATPTTPMHSRPTPVLINDVPADQVAEIGVGGSFTAVRTLSGDVYVTGLLFSHESHTFTRLSGISNIQGLAAGNDRLVMVSNL